MKEIQVTMSVPDWVNWKAKDKDGEVYGYEDKPSISSSLWDLSWDSPGRIILLHCNSCEKMSNWKDSLVRV